MFFFPKHNISTTYCLHKYTASCRREIHTSSDQRKDRKVLQEGKNWQDDKKSGVRVDGSQRSDG